MPIDASLIYIAQVNALEVQLECNCSKSMYSRSRAMAFFALQCCLRQGSQFCQLSPMIVHFCLHFRILSVYIWKWWASYYQTTLYLLCVYGAQMSLLTALLGSLVGESTKPRPQDDKEEHFCMSISSCMDWRCQNCHSHVYY